MDARSLRFLVALRLSTCSLSSGSHSSLKVYCNLLYSKMLGSEMSIRDSVASLLFNFYYYEYSSAPPSSHQAANSSTWVL